MKISKRDALTLAKILVHHVRDDGETKTEHEDDLVELSDRIDSYLSDEDGTCSDHCEDHHKDAEDDEEEEDEDDEEVEDDGDEEEDLDDEEDEEEDEEDEDSDEEEDEDGVDGAEELEADCFVTPAELNGLKPLKSDGAVVEFEDCDDDSDTVAVIEDGFTEFTITHLRRKGKELHICSDEGDWYVYEVERFPAGWASVLPLNQLVEVER
jgi:hypothetical protein